MSTSKRTITDADKKEAREYLRSRGFTPPGEVMAAYGLSVVWDRKDEHLRLRIPFLDGDGVKGASGAYGTGRFLGTEEELERHEDKMRAKREADREERQTGVFVRHVDPSV